MVAIFSMQYTFLTIFYCLSIALHSNSHQFNLYHTKYPSNGFDRDCLYYFIFNHVTVPQFVEYCIRSSLEEVQRTKFSHYDQSFTFKELHDQNISSYQLYTWLAPIDLIELYQIYLENNLSRSDFTFYNCTYPWFGSYCEYTFDQHRARLSFAEQVELSFAEKRYDDNYFPETLPCYTYIMCDRVGNHSQTGHSCLDWREVCDGVISCLNNYNDEEHCWQLEINECDPQTEFRCHNGLCIPLPFLNDDIHNPDCLDRSDEYFMSTRMLVDLDPSEQIPKMCHKIPAFKCEEHTCRPTGLEANVKFECGDGSITAVSDTMCANGRHKVLRKAMVTGVNMSDKCRLAFECVIGYHLLYHNYDSSGEVCKLYSGKNYTMIVKQECPSLIELEPMIFGNVHFVYSNNMVKEDTDFDTTPDYICYNKEFCENNLLSLSKDNPIDLFGNNSTCVSLNDLRIPSAQWFGGIMEWMYSIFRKCAMHYELSLITNYSNLYSCVNSSKIISQDRLLDGVQDCFHGDDELYTESCSLNNTKYRFKCVADNSNLVCLSRVRLNDNIYDCKDNSDEQDLNDKKLSKTRISISTMCDGFTELEPILINEINETDETECSQFPCNNTYTRCDGTWNCLDGADEVNCEWPPLCPSFHHMCLSILTNNLTCLHIKHANNGIIDCFGSYDERQFCRENESNPDGAFRCENSSKCVHFESIRHKPFLCLSSNSIRQFYDPFLMTAAHSCATLTNLTYIGQIFCLLTDSRKAPNLHLSLTVNSSAEWITQFDIQRFDTTPQPEIWNNLTKRNMSMVWRCNRGILIYRWNESVNDSQPLCLCPPAYYGDLCQYENQRVSLTIQTQLLFDWRILFVIVITLRDDDQDLTESYNQFNYLAMRNCDTKFNIYLLYSTRPKNTSTNHSVYIDIYQKDTLKYRASWRFPILFPFLPVYRLPVLLHVPVDKSDIKEGCQELNCGIHGHCSRYENTKKLFCRCDKDWVGISCDIFHKCNCSSDALCLNSSICICPTGRFGHYCHLKYPFSCQCKNGGSCLTIDEKMDENNKMICICPDGFSGSTCEKIDSGILISFASDIIIPKSILIHFIEVFGIYKPHTHSTIFKKIEVYQDTITIYRSRPFHLIFVETEDKMIYNTFMQQKYILSMNSSTTVTLSNRCQHIRELFNESFVNMHVLRRMKYYHSPCKQYLNLTCFYDDINMCICNADLQQSNCFTFDTNVSYNCEGNNMCQNNGKCFQDYKKCPTLSMCVCDECSYGSRCQLSTKGFDLSLDAILGYHIYSNISLSKQKSIIKSTIGITSIILVLGVISNILSILTFISKESRENSCGIYLLTSSITSVIIMVVFAFKFNILIMTQMGLIINYNYLLFHCQLIDFIIAFLLSAVDWLNACVGIERAIIAVYDVHFDKVKHRKTAKWIVGIIYIIVITTHIQDPIYRNLIIDEEDNRIWCIVEYPSSIRTFNTVILILHFFIPFVTNIISACVIIHSLAQQRSISQRQQTYLQHLRIQFKQFKYLLISPIVFILLALPRLIISFLSNCMKSPRDPWLYLFAYLFSFIPPMSTFIVFIYFSTTFKKEFKKTIERINRNIRIRWENRPNWLAQCCFSR